MENLVHAQFEKHAGEFLNVQQDNMEFSMRNGRVRIKDAEVKPEVFDDLHLPFFLRGGFIEEVGVDVPMSLFGSSPAKVHVQNVFAVVGPHVTDWSYDHVSKCKNKLLDLIDKVKDITSPKKKKKQKAPKGGFFADVQKRMIEDMKKRFLGMLEVHVSNVQIRFEDFQTQESPYAAGFKIGFIFVTSKADPQSLRTTGEWKHSTERHSDFLFCQQILMRRLSAYWDVNEAKDSMFSAKRVAGKECFDKFTRWSLRETFRDVAVEKLCEIFPADHKRRKYLEGPCFRERFDFHQYVVFPASLNANVTVNKVTDAMLQQKAPMKDADVICEPLELAIDSEQVRSINELLEFVKDFRHKDELFRTRPREPISSVVRPQAASSSGSGGSGSMLSRITMKSSGNESGKAAASADASDQAAQKRAVLISAWWQHAFNGVRLTCNIPRLHLSPLELHTKAKQRDTYINIYTKELENRLDREAAQKESKSAPAPKDLPPSDLVLQMREMHMSLTLPDIIMWRNMARQKRLDRLGHEAEEQEDPKVREEAAKHAAEEAAKPHPNTLQLRAHFKAFQAYFLIVSGSNWSLPMQSGGGEALEPRRPTRQLMIRGGGLDVRAEMVQKGSAKHRLARWIELSVGSIAATNCQAQKSQPSTRQILSITPFEHRTGTPLCVYVGLNMLEVASSEVQPGQISITAVLEPSEGVASHLKVNGDDPQLLEKLGFLKKYKDESGRRMMFIFTRVGQVRALHYAPFGRRIEHFLRRGKKTTTTDLVRRPSALALDRELLVQLQRKVEKLTGKSNDLGILEGVTDGVRARLVDHYNSQHVLCKEVSLAPMRCIALRNGSPPTFHVQFHQKLQSEDRDPRRGNVPRSVGDSFGLLPWKVAMQLLPKADFSMGLEGHRRELEDAGTKPSTMSQVAKDRVESTEPSTVVLVGMVFSKWGRNGKMKRRFIVFDENVNAVLWKNDKKDSKVIGAIPLSKITDICTGVSTPVLQNVKSSKLRADRVWSIIATDRTLDLQAHSAAQREIWVTGLKSRYKKYVQSLGSDGASPLPRALASKAKAYPERFRSDRCALKLTYRKIQAVTKLSKTSKEVKKSQEEPQGSDAEGSARPLMTE